MIDPNLDRRQFVTLSAAGLAAGLRPHSSSLDRIHVGIVGCGGRGGWVLGQLEKLKEKANVTVTALCDVWRPAREKMAARVEKGFGSKPLLYARYQDLLARREVDAVVITTPDFAHCPVLIAAVEAGKDAYCEKPMAKTLDQANGALDAVGKHGRVVQIGTQRRSDGRFAAAAEFISSGGLGKVVEIDTAWHDNSARWARGYSDVKEADVDWEAYQLYLEPRPFDPRRYRCWHLYHDYTVGPVGLLGSHMIDAAIWMAGDPYPNTAVALGGTYLWKPREQADTIECLWEYPKGWLLRYGTRMGNAKRGPEVTVYGTKGVFDTNSWTATPDGGGKGRLEKPVKVEAGESVGHVQDWLACIRSREKTNAPIEAGHAHAVATIMAYDAWVTGRRQRWDQKTKSILEG